MNRNEDRQIIRKEYETDRKYGYDMRQTENKEQDRDKKKISKKIETDRI